VRSGGRKGRRTALMVRIAVGRIADLFVLAEKEALGGSLPLADRYVELARRIGMRYNVRLPAEYSDRYCRGCSHYWIEGKTVRTRLRSGHRVRTCLVCRRERRVRYRPPRKRQGEAPAGVVRPTGQLRQAQAVPGTAPENGGDQGPGTGRTMR